MTEPYQGGPINDFPPSSKNTENPATSNTSPVAEDATENKSVSEKSFTEKANPHKAVERVGSKKSSGHF